jgi:hypothetical protein
VERKTVLVAVNNGLPWKKPSSIYFIEEKKIQQNPCGEKNPSLLLPFLRQRPFFGGQIRLSGKRRVRTIPLS